MAKKEAEVKQMEIYEFSYFLDAWLYCEQNKIYWPTAIKKKDFRTWMVIA